jgi:hypothetical protein
MWINIKRRVYKSYNSRVIVGIETDHGLDGRPSILHSVQSGCGTHPNLLSNGCRVLFSRWVNPPRGEAGNSPLSSADVKYDGSIPLLLHTSS